MLGLHALDRRTQRRLRDSHPLRGAREVELLGDGDEIANAPEIDVRDVDVQPCLLSDCRRSHHRHETAVVTLARVNTGDNVGQSDDRMSLVVLIFHLLSLLTLNPGSAYPRS